MEVLRPRFLASSLRCTDGVCMFLSAQVHSLTTLLEHRDSM